MNDDAKKKAKMRRRWLGMLSRCHNPHNSGFHNYGQRGIFVCDRWRNSFDDFYKDMGDIPEGMSLDRIDNDKGYSPENCRAATPSEQVRNRRPAAVLAMRPPPLTEAEKDAFAASTGYPDRAAGRPLKDPAANRVTLAVRVHPKTKDALSKWSKAIGKSVGEIIDSIVRQSV